MKQFFTKLKKMLRGLFPQKGDRRRDVVFKCTLLLLIAVFVVSFCFWLAGLVESRQNDARDAALRQEHQSTSSSTPPAPVSSSSGQKPILPDLTALYAQNRDLIGWIKVPGTNIDYPVVQTKDEDKNHKNEKYLTTSFDGTKEKHGTIFLDYRNTIKPLSQVSILYGHNMKDNKMFGELEKYCKAKGKDYLGFYNQNPLIEFDTLYDRNQWKIFAVFVTTADSRYDGSLYYLDVKHPSTENFDSFMKDVRARSFINTAVDVRPSDNLLTLSTCNYDYPSNDKEWARLVVMARRVRDGESTAVGPATKNTSIVYPKVWNIK